MLPSATHVSLSAAHTRVNRMLLGLWWRIAILGRPSEEQTNAKKQNPHNVSPPEATCANMTANRMVKKRARRKNWRRSSDGQGKGRISCVVIGHATSHLDGAALPIVDGEKGSICYNWIAGADLVHRPID